MHTYLEAAGFKHIESRREMEQLIGNTVLHHDEKYIFKTGDGQTLAEFSRNYAPDIGLTVCGEMDEEGNFHPDYSFPYFRGAAVSAREELSFEKHAGKDSFAGALDDARAGVTVIFYLSNMGRLRGKGLLRDGASMNGAVKLSGLAKEGAVVLPVHKTRRWVEEDRRRSRDRAKMINAAKKGDEDAIESLTLEDMDAYDMVTRRVQRKEDVLSIVETSFMPYGIECDQYSIIGEIVSCEKVRNDYSGEGIWQLGLSVCDIPIDVCIHEERLLGEPKIGRRFRGLIWLLGEACF